MTTSETDHAALVAAERAAFAELLSGLGAAALDAPSLCDGWSNRDVACHVAALNRAGIWGSLGALVLSGFSPRRLNDRQLAAWRRRSDAEVAAAVGRPRIAGLLRLMPAGALTEVVIHQQDVRRPTGRARAYSAACLRAVLDASCRSGTGTGSARRARGLRLRATDIDWMHGEGPEVAGPAEALIMALNGRPAAAADLGGEGLPALLSRLAGRAAARAGGEA